MQAKLIEGVVQYKEISGEYCNVELNQGNPRYPVRIGVSRAIYDQVKEGQKVEFENVVIIPKVSKKGTAWLTCFIPS